MRETQTIGLNKTSGLWFLAAFEDNSICIDYALAHTPSAKISELVPKLQFWNSSL
jgi:hypothetical protein